MVKTRGVVDVVEDVFAGFVVEKKDRITNEHNGGRVVAKHVGMNGNRRRRRRRTGIKAVERQCDIVMFAGLMKKLVAQAWLWVD